MPLFSYLDASAIVKLVAREPETAALENALAHREGLLTSQLSLVEVTRAARRAASRRLLPRVDEVFDALVLVHPSTSILAAAAAMPPVELRSLDAIHLGTALSLDLGSDGDLEFITYDARLASAARTAGLTVNQPR